MYNKFTHDSTSNLSVPKSYKAPVFLEELVAGLTEQGTVSLECKVVGIPSPSLRWYRDGEEIRSGKLIYLMLHVYMQHVMFCFIKLDFLIQFSQETFLPCKQAWSVLCLSTGATLSTAWAQCPPPLSLTFQNLSAHSKPSHCTEFMLELHC